MSQLNTILLSSHTFFLVQGKAEAKKKLRDCHAHMGTGDTHDIVSEELLEIGT